MKALTKAIACASLAAVLAACGGGEHESREINIKNTTSAEETVEPGPEQESPDDTRGENDQKPEQQQGKIDQHIVAIEAALNQAVLDTWMDATGDKLINTLEAFGVKTDKATMVNVNGTYMFDMADQGKLVTAWQKTPFKCEIGSSNADTYKCTMTGDWGTQPAYRSASQWPAQLDQMREVMQYQWHGPDGSERHIKELTFLIKMDKDHDSGTMTMAPQELLGL